MCLGCYLERPYNSRPFCWWGEMGAERGQMVPCISVKLQNSPVYTYSLSAFSFLSLISQDLSHVIQFLKVLTRHRQHQQPTGPLSCVSSTVFLQLFWLLSAILFWCLTPWVPQETEQPGTLIPPLTWLEAEHLGFEPYSDMGYRCCKQQVKPLCHKAGPSRVCFRQI